MGRPRWLRLLASVAATALLGAGCFGPAPGGGSPGGTPGGGGGTPTGQPCTGGDSLRRSSETFTEVDATTFDVTVPGDYENNSNRRRVLLGFSLWIVADGTTVTGPATVADDPDDEFSNLNATPNLEADAGDVVPFALALRVTFPSAADVDFGDPWTTFMLSGLAPGEPPCS